MKNDGLLSLKQLCVNFYTEAGEIKAVQDVSFSIGNGQTFALVGESGCGKSATALSIMRLLPAEQSKIAGGEIFFDGQNLLTLSERQMRQIRGNKITMIFQEPMTSLNPIFTVGDQIAEAMKLHCNFTKNNLWRRTVMLLQKVGIAEPERRALDYPHQLSGGMRQRVMIAMAISCGPKLLIADEPTTALDTTVQVQVLDLLEHLKQQNGMSILLITHDLGIVAERADRIAVMYASRIVEMAGVNELFTQPYHPYTQGLLRSLPRPGSSGRRLPTIPGAVPEPLRYPAGCKFHPRCWTGHVNKRCQTVEPELREMQPGRHVACWYAHRCEKL